MEEGKQLFVSNGPDRQDRAEAVVHFSQHGPSLHSCITELLALHLWGGGDGKAASPGGEGHAGTCVEREGRK